MDRLLLASDYQEGCCQDILERLAETNLQKSSGYGTDEFCESAREKIRAACACPDAAVHFLSGGTQTNATVIAALLKPWQGVIAAETGHINGHEAGAVEAGGHKVLTLPHTNGKIAADSVRQCCEAYRNDENHEHTVMPGMVYLSQPTEYGTLYSLSELTEIRSICDRYQLSLYVDGARLAYALACPVNDVTLPDLARLCDAFYIGGTKCGALFGEAVVVPDPDTIPCFFTFIKQRGALLAKGRILGIQFDTLFTDDLYLKLGKPAIKAADRMRSLFAEAGYPLLFGSPTNQVFVLLEDGEKERLAKEVGFGFWEKPDIGHTIVRFASGWATTSEDIDRLERIVRG
ncbi:MAG: low specificity L-threonine aldolase [Oscillospiraceae bacterium]|nr:low specificity L-threonine aldolase [Oscillospiraceae bacterium]